MNACDIFVIKLYEAGSRLSDFPCETRGVVEKIDDTEAEKLCTGVKYTHLPIFCHFFPDKNDDPPLFLANFLNAFANALTFYKKPRDLNNSNF